MRHKALEIASAVPDIPISQIPLMSITFPCESTFSTGIEILSTENQIAAEGRMSAKVGPMRTQNDPSDKNTFRVSFAEVAVNLASDGLVLAVPSDLRSRGKTNIFAKQLADYCHIYMVLRRPGLMFVPGKVSDSDNIVFGRIQLMKAGQGQIVDFAVPHSGPKLVWTVTDFPHRLIESDPVFPSYRESLPAYVVPSLGRVAHSSAHEAEVLYIGQSFGDGSRTALDRLLEHSTLQSVLADAIYQTPDQDILLLLFRYAPPKFHMLIPPESTYPAWYKVDDVEVQAEIDQRFDQVSRPAIPLKNLVSIIEAALINYFKPSYNDKFVRQEPQPSHQHLVECYNEDFSALVVEVNTEDAQIALYSGVRSPGIHHVARYDLHSAKKRKNFFRLLCFDDEIGLLESGPISPISSLKNGRFAILAL